MTGKRKFYAFWGSVVVFSATTAIIAFRIGQADLLGFANAVYTALILLLGLFVSGNGIEHVAGMFKAKYNAPD